MSVQCKWRASNTEINYLRKKRVLRRRMLIIGRLNLLISINNFENEWEKLVDAKVSHKLLESAKLWISLDIRYDS